MIDLHVLDKDELVALICKQEKELGILNRCFKKIEEALDKANAKENKWF